MGAKTPRRQHENNQSRLIVAHFNLASKFISIMRYYCWCIREAKLNFIAGHSSDNSKEGLCKNLQNHFTFTDISSSYKFSRGLLQIKANNRISWLILLYNIKILTTCIGRLINTSDFVFPYLGIIQIVPQIKMIIDLIKSCDNTMQKTVS